MAARASVRHAIASGKALEVLPSGEARTNFSQVLKGFREAGLDAKPVVVGAHRKPEAVIISYSVYERLVDYLDDLAIAEEARARLSRPDRHGLDLDEAMAELGYDQVEAKRPAARG